MLPKLSLAVGGTVQLHSLSRVIGHTESHKLVQLVRTFSDGDALRKVVVLTEGQLTWGSHDTSPDLSGREVVTLTTSSHDLSTGVLTRIEGHLPSRIVGMLVDGGMTVITTHDFNRLNRVIWHTLISELSHAVVTFLKLLAILEVITLTHHGNATLR